jgi:hypothetical protein
MSTPNQIEANRRNAQKSTGPRTDAGKAVSRFNALKSGIDAKAQVIPGEDPTELETLTRDYHQQWQPATPLECFLTDALVHADWQLRRLRRVEAQLWQNEIADTRKSFRGLNEETPLGQVFDRSADSMTRLQRRIDSTERSYYRALTQLQRLNAGERPAPDLPEPAPETESPSPELGSFPTISPVPNGGLASPPPPASCQPSGALDMLGPS